MRKKLHHTTQKRSVPTKEGYNVWNKWCIYMGHLGSVWEFIKEWNRMEWNGMVIKEMEWNGIEWNGFRRERKGMEWNGMKFKNLV